MADDQNKVLADFRAYTDAFNSLKPSAIAAHYHEPCLLVVPPGVFSLASKAEVERVFSDFLRDLVSRGFVRCAYEGLQATMLSGSDAMVSGICVRLDGNGGVLERFGHTCTLRRNKEQWRIAVNAIHEPDRVLHLRDPA